MYPKVYIILLNYNGWADTIECLESVLRNDYPNYQVIVVDNDSPNNSMEYIKAWAEGKLDVWVNPENPLRKLSFPPTDKPIPYVYYTREEAEKGGNIEIEKELESKVPESITTKYPLVFIQSGYNGGFAFGNNVAIKYALAKNDFDYILLLNNDTVVKKDFLKKMIESFSMGENIGIVGCKIYYYDGPNKIWFNGGKFNEWVGRAIHIQKEIDKEFSECNFITGCCMLIKRKILEKIGLLDEAYFMYVEDWDYCLRVLKKGYKMLCHHKAIIYHKVGAEKALKPTEFSVYYTFRNRILFIKKHILGVQKVFAIFFILFTRLLRLPLFVRYPSLFTATLNGIINGFKKT